MSIENNVSDIKESAKNWSSLKEKISQISNPFGDDVDLKNSNANVNGTSVQGKMSQIGTELTKMYALENMVSKRFGKAHKNGDIHIHDLDYYLTKTTTCNQIPLGQMLKNGIWNEHGYIRPPKGIKTAAALAAVIFQYHQNQQHGGQSFASFDFDMAPYVKLTFDKIKNNLINDIEFLDGDKEIDENKLDERAWELTENETLQAMEALVHNLNTMHSRAGAQVPFTSINFGLDTSKEGRMVSKCLMQAQSNGLGNGETPIFPILVFKVKEGINYNPEDKNYDLLKMSFEVTAKRLFPNWIFEDAPFNLDCYDEKHPELSIATMGCVDGDQTITYKINDKIYKDVKFEKAFEEIKKLGEAKEDEFGNILINNFSSLEVLDGQKFVKVISFIKNKKENVGKWLKFTFENGKEWLTTHDHPFLIVNKGRTFAENVKIGDKVFDENNNKLEIVDIEESDYVGDSYDLETESDTFDISGIRSHNCRTRLARSVFKESDKTSVKRGNISFTSINLPRLGILANKNIDKFFELLDEKLDLVHDQLLERYKYQCTADKTEFEYMVKNKTMIGAEEFEKSNNAEDMVKHGSLSIGFIGLAETLVSLIGKHHGESDEAQQLGLKIVKHMRDYCDKKAEEEKLNWSLLGTPAESLCFSGDTEVQTPFGNKKIKDIKAGDLVFSYNENNDKIEIKEVTYSGLTRKNSDVIKITFDTGQNVVCTKNHLLALRKKNTWEEYRKTGKIERIEYAKAEDLRIGDRVKSNYIEDSPSGYRRFKNKKSYVHRMIYEYYFGKLDKNMIVHHKDGDKRNNSIENLESMTSKEHKIFHLKDTIGKYTFTHENTSGKNNPFYGKTHTEETKRKISETKRIRRLFNEEKNHKVIKIEELQEKEDVYDISVQDNHNFFVGGDRGILVHNCGRAAKIDLEKFGKIDGVTDHEFYTNSSHVPVYHKISAFKKIEIEAPYHELENAGHICYIEMDGDPSNNIEAVEKVVRKMHDEGIGYSSINHPVDRCKDCGFSGIMNDKCPICGSTDIERLRRITGYLVGDLKRWNGGKRAEEKQRVKHI